MTIVLVLLAVFVVAFAVTTTVNKLGERWGQLPHFVTNYCTTGVRAICSVADFKKAYEKAYIGEKEAGFIRVPETLMFANLSFVKRQPAIVQDKFSGGLSWMGTMPEQGDFYSFREETQLFVPLLSGGYMPFSEQVKFFSAPQDPVEFCKRKQAENCADDYRLRFAKWQHRYRYRLGDYQLCSLVASVVMVFALLIAAANRMEKSEHAAPTTMHVTKKDGSTQAITAAGEDKDWLLMVEDGQENIFKGNALKLQELGGGLSRVCIARPSNQLRCGFAGQALHLKEGDEVYIRYGYLMHWSNNLQPGHRTTDDWVITKAEAESLVANSNGRFTIVD